MNALPSQLSPFLVEPGPHSQMKDPGVLKHSLSGEPHTLSTMLHSSTSVEIVKQCFQDQRTIPEMNNIEECHTIIISKNNNN